MDDSQILYEQVAAGETHDGLMVPEGYRLAFTLLVAERSGDGIWDGTLFGASIHWQKAAQKRRPFLSFELGSFHFQSGWLWFNPSINLKEESCSSTYHF